MGVGEKMRSITENTLLPISLVVTILGGAAFITHIYFQTNANAEAIREIRMKQDGIMSIQSDIAVMKKQLELIEKKLNGSTR